MDSSRKKLYVVIAFVLLLIGIIALVWYLNQRSGGELIGGELPNSDPRQETPGTDLTPEGTIITEGEEASREIAKNVISGMFAPNSNTVRYIERASGLVYERPLTGGVAIALSDTRLDNAYVVDWANNGSAALVTFSTQNNTPDFAHISFTSSSSQVTRLPETTAFAAVSPDGLRVAFAKQTDDGSVIATALPNGTKPTTLASHPQSQLLLSWDVVARPIVRNPGSAFVESLAWVLSGGSYTPLTPASYQLSILEHSSGRYVLYSAAETISDMPTLYLLDTKATSTKDRITIAPFTTYPEKCVWARTDTSIIYCGVPSSITKQIYDAWLRGEHHFEDRITRWNFRTGEVRIVSEGNYDAIELAVAPDDSALLFVNKNDSSLWSLVLQK